MLQIIRYRKQGRSRIPLAVVLVGQDHHQEAIDRPHGLEIFQWFYCKSGSGELILNGRHYHIVPGMCFLIFPNDPHVYRKSGEEGGEDWVIDVIGFTGASCPSILQALGMVESGAYAASDTGIFEVYIQKIMESLTLRATEREQLISVLGYQFLLSLSWKLRPWDLYDIESQENPIVRSLILYIEEHYAQPITLDTMAEYLQISKGHMQVIFKKEMGQTIGEFLLNYRIIQARNMLITTPDKKVKDIGTACGFESPSYFGKQFKRVVGKTPEQFRK